MSPACTQHGRKWLQGARQDIAHVLGQRKGYKPGRVGLSIIAAGRRHAPGDVELARDQGPSS
jgi:hypothetical protein